MEVVSADVTEPEVLGNLGTAVRARRRVAVERCELRRERVFRGLRLGENGLR
jgi:hypothetical protein